MRGNRNRRLMSWMVVCAAATALVSCRAEEGRRAPHAAVPVATDVEGGILEGVVRLGGEEMPEPTRVENTTDPEVCGLDHTLENMVVAPQNRGIANVILSLAGIPEEKIPSVPAERLVLDNADCRFVPHAGVLTVGSVIEAVNSDPILHTTHLYGPLEANLALRARGPGISRTVEKPGMIIVKCDVHSWMQAFIRVDSHPFHAVSDTRGSFRIPGIPPGSYTLEVWHETLGSQQKPVRIEAGKKQSVEILYSPDDD